MLFSAWAWDGMRAGTITVTFRRWKRPQVVAGRHYRSPVGMLHVTSIEVVDPQAIPDEDAGRAGFATAAELRSYLRDGPEPVYRIEFRLGGEDPRTRLQDDTALTDADVDEITERLDRLDRASKHGAWTRPTLAAIAAEPGRRAADLAAAAGRDKPSFKLDVRKLKNLGLTISLDVGYRLSPRGEAYLRASSQPRGEDE
jgi:hypothetical protein